jgi:hypothetical protein
MTETAAVDVRRERAAEGQVIGAGLLLDDAPPVRLVCEGPQQVVDQLYPVDSRFDGHQSALPIDIDHPIEGGHVHERAAGTELLPSHRVAAATETEALTRATRGGNQLLQLASRARPKPARDVGGIELRVDVVYHTVMTEAAGDPKSAGPAGLRDDGVHAPRR